MKKNNKPIEVRILEPEKRKYESNPSKKVAELFILILVVLTLFSLPITLAVLEKLSEIKEFTTIVSYFLVFPFVYLIVPASPIFDSDKYTLKAKLHISKERIFKERKLTITILIFILLIFFYVTIQVKWIQYLILVPLLAIEWYFLMWIVSGIFTAIDYFIHVDLKEENAFVSNILSVLPIIISIIALFYSVKGS